MNKKQTNTDEAQDLVKIRVWADDSEIEDLADLVVGRLEGAGLILAERSEACACQSPKEHESRVYLKFMAAEWLR